MNKTIEAFNEKVLLAGDSETLEQLRAVSNAVASIQRETEHEEKRLRDSGLFTDEGVKDRMRVFVSDKARLLETYEKEVVKPRSATAQGSLTDENRYMAFDPVEQQMAIERFNAGPQFRRDMIVKALTDDAKLAAMLSQAPDHLVTLDDETRMLMREKSNLADTDKRAALQREVDAAGYVSTKIEMTKDELMRKWA